jgi:hypothetical protein
MPFTNTVISLLNEAMFFDLDSVSLTDIITGLRTMIKYFFVSSLNAKLDLGFCHRVKPPSQRNRVSVNKMKQQNHYLNTVVKIPRNFADMRTGSLIWVDNFLFVSIYSGNYDLVFCTCWF